MFARPSTVSQEFNLTAAMQFCLEKIKNAVEFDDAISSLNIPGSSSSFSYDPDTKSLRFFDNENTPSGPHIVTAIYALLGSEYPAGGINALIRDLTFGQVTNNSMIMSVTNECDVAKLIECFKFTIAKHSNVKIISHQKPGAPKSGPSTDAMTALECIVSVLDAKQSVTGLKIPGCNSAITYHPESHFLSIYDMKFNSSGTESNPRIVASIENLLGYTCRMIPNLEYTPYNFQLNGIAISPETKVYAGKTMVLSVSGQKGMKMLNDQLHATAAKYRKTETQTSVLNNNNRSLGMN